jgi:hypothetical protein
MKNFLLVLALILLTSCYTVIRVTETSSPRIIHTTYSTPVSYYSSYSYRSRYYVYPYKNYYDVPYWYYTPVYTTYRPVTVIEYKKKESKPKTTSYTPPRTSVIRTTGVDRTPTRPTPPHTRRLEPQKTVEGKKTETRTSSGEVRRADTGTVRGTTTERKTESENKGTVKRGN